MTPPLLAVTGRKHAGKTTLVVRLCAALTRRGHRVGTIKHGSHDFSLDPAGTDTWRHLHEGDAERVAMIAPSRFALVMRRPDEETPEAVAARHMAGLDLVLCEGFKGSMLPKVEVFRRAAHPDPLYAPDAPLAPTWRGIVSDADDWRPAAPPGGEPPRLFPLTDPGWLDALADWVEQTFLPGPPR